LYIAAPNTDQLFMPEQRARAVEILAENEQKFNMQIFSGVSHGFAVSLAAHTLTMLDNVYLSSQTRSHPEDSYAEWSSKKAFESFVEWFDFWLLQKDKSL
jgi:dienelactone hydrolase